MRELGIGQLTEGEFDISVTAIDTDDPLAKSMLHDTGTAYDDVIVGGLRTAPIPQRKYDVVYRARLIDRIQHVELVLDRLLPLFARRIVWSRLYPGIPGPFPAVYERRPATRASPPA